MRGTPVIRNLGVTEGAIVQDTQPNIQRILFKIRTRVRFWRSISRKLRKQAIRFHQSINERGNNIKIDQITTDRQVQVRKYMNEEWKDICLQFDIWHVVKSVKKKLCALGKKKANRDLNGWIRSICNHLWRSCATCDGDAELLKEKWTSLLHHIKNKHSWDSNKKFHRCLHEPLTNDQQRTKKWLVEGSPAYKTLQDIILDKKLISDLQYLVKFAHTGGLEVYHALLGKYCPKSRHFSYRGMLCRCQLAALDHNAGAQLPQAKTKQGDLRYNISFTKHGKNWVAKPIKCAKDKSYVLDTVERVVDVSKHDVQVPPEPQVPDLPKNIASTPQERHYCSTSISFQYVITNIHDILKILCINMITSIVTILYDYYLFAQISK